MDDVCDRSKENKTFWKSIQSMAATYPRFFPSFLMQQRLCLCRKKRPSVTALYSSCCYWSRPNCLLGRSMPSINNDTAFNITSGSGSFSHVTMLNISTINTLFCILYA